MAVVIYATLIAGVDDRVGASNTTAAPHKVYHFAP